jgi:hypothetical protein
MNLAKKFVIDADPSRYPALAGDLGDGPRVPSIKLRQAKHFLVENMLLLANDGNAGYAPDGKTQGSNSYPATSSPGVALEGAVGQPNTEAAVQPRFGTVRNIHCENCTRGYGITEIHAGVDIDFRYVSSRGGMTIRWESAGGGKSTRQTAEQCVSFDGNAVFLMSNHGYLQDDLHASHGVAYGSDDGVRTNGERGKTRNSTITHVDVYAGPRAQVIEHRDSTDDFWWYDQSERAIDNVLGVSVGSVRCKGSFQDANRGGACSGVAP